MQCHESEMPSVSVVILQEMKLWRDAKICPDPKAHTAPSADLSWKDSGVVLARGFGAVASAFSSVPLWSVGSGPGVHVKECSD